MPIDQESRTKVNEDVLGRERKACHSIELDETNRMMSISIENKRKFTTESAFFRHFHAF